MKKTAVLILGALAVSAGCSTTLNVKSWEPGEVAVGGADRMIVADAEGRRSARETVAILLAKNAQSMGYFQVDDLSADGVKIDVHGREATIEHYEQEMKGNELFVRADVLEWSADRDVEEYTETQGTGKNRRQVTKTRPVLKGRVLLQVTVSDAKGRALLAEKEFEGMKSFSGDVDREVAIEGAAEEAVKEFLASITPRQVTNEVRVDDSDDKQASIIKTAENGAVAQAAEDMGAFVKENPNSASGHYNLAVFLDAQGRYDEALPMYDKAMSLGGPGWYSDARAACAKRLGAAEALRN